MLVRREREPLLGLLLLALRRHDHRLPVRLLRHERLRGSGRGRRGRDALRLLRRAEAGLRGCPRGTARRVRWVQLNLLLLMLLRPLRPARIRVRVPALLLLLALRERRRLVRRRGAALRLWRRRRPRMRRDGRRERRRLFRYVRAPRVRGCTRRRLRLLVVAEWALLLLRRRSDPGRRRLALVRGGHLRRAHRHGLLLRAGHDTGRLLGHLRLLLLLLAARLRRRTVLQSAWREALRVRRRLHPRALCARHLRLLHPWRLRARRLRVLLLLLQVLEPLSLRLLQAGRVRLRQALRMGPRRLRRRQALCVRAVRLRLLHAVDLALRVQARRLRVRGSRQLRVLWTLWLRMLRRLRVLQALVHVL